MPSLAFRQGQPDDAAAIRLVVHAAYQKWVPVLGRAPRPMHADYAEALRAHRFDLVEENGTLIGLIETDTRADHLWIENVAVLPSAQGRGIGRALLAHAEALARAAGYPKLCLLTNGKMTANRKLYAALGYREDREEPFMDGTIVYLSKTIAML